MAPTFDRSLVLCGLVMVVLSFAPARQEKEKEPVKAAALSEARQRAALRQYDLVWQYYQQNRVETFDVYLWSRLLLDSRQKIGRKPADRIAALEEHLDHMTRLEALVKKVRRLGFGRSNDVGASEYWRIEAECWLAEARAG
jgi:hypothetical protein